MTEQTEQAAVAQENYGKTFADAWNRTNSEGKLEMLAVSVGLVKNVFTERLDRECEEWMRLEASMDLEEFGSHVERVHGLVQAAFGFVEKHHGTTAKKHVLSAIVISLLELMADKLPHHVDIQIEGAK